MVGFGSWRKKKKHTNFVGTTKDEMQSNTCMLSLEELKIEWKKCAPASEKYGKMIAAYVWEKGFLPSMPRKSPKKSSTSTTSSSS